MLAVLMSMKPEWWEKILDGEKTLEIRKTHPQNERLEWPVTVLVYVSGTGAVQIDRPGVRHIQQSGARSIPLPWGSIIPNHARPGRNVMRSA